jgi:hypothetical protein
MPRLVPNSNCNGNCWGAVLLVGMSWKLVLWDDRDPERGLSRPVAGGQPVNLAIGASDQAVDTGRDEYRRLERGAEGGAYPPCHSRSEGRPASSALTATSTVGGPGLEGSIRSVGGAGSSMRLRWRHPAVRRGRIVTLWVPGASSGRHLLSSARGLANRRVSRATCPGAGGGSHATGSASCASVARNGTGDAEWGMMISGPRVQPGRNSLGRVQRLVSLPTVMRHRPVG